MIMISPFLFSSLRKNIFFIIIFVALASPFYAQTSQESLKLMQEYEQSQKRNRNTGIMDQENQALISPTILSPDQATIIPFKTDEADVDSSSLYFGYDFFNLRDEVIFSENLPTPASYVLGPGDEIIIAIWGETQLHSTYTITKDGKIYDDKVGLLHPSHKTIKDVRDYVKKQFARVYATLKDPNPTSFIDVSLGELGSINVNFVGELTYPGIYAIHPFSTVITGLIQAGGVDSTGSLRNIQVKRENELAFNVDLYDYLLKGNLPKNIQLRDQDIVIVPVRKSTIKVDSAVVRPGIYESRPGETILQIIDYAGGLKVTASETIGLKRIISSKERVSKDQSIENYYIEFENANIATVQNGDNITVRSMFKNINQVEIIGQVKTPGIYYFNEGMQLQDLIDLGGGFRDSTFLKTINFKQSELIRRNPKSRYDQIIPINLGKLIAGDKLENIRLQNTDRFVVHANKNYFEKENIKILGEVQVPGSYPQLSDQESLQSFIDRADGFTSKAHTEGIEIFRDSLRVAWENTNIPLAPGDSVVIKEKRGVVMVKGEVYNSGLVEFQKGKSLKYYLDAAGGITPEGNRNDVLVIYANGVVKPKKLLNVPRVKDGSTIIVNMKEIEETFNPTELAATVASFLSSIVTIIVLSQQIQG